MIFKSKKIRYSTNNHWIAKRDNFIFNLQDRDKEYWFVVVSHNIKDIRFNSLWENIKFKTFEIAKEWCEIFDYTKFNCLGDDK